jgi:hypothetical protein
MSFGDLAAEHKADTRFVGFGREKGNEEFRGVGDARSFVENQKLQLRSSARPLDSHAAARLTHRIGSVSHQVDQQLFQFVSIGANCEIGALTWESSSQNRTRLP